MESEDLHILQDRFIRSAIAVINGAVAGQANGGEHLLQAAGDGNTGDRGNFLTVAVVGQTDLAADIVVVQIHLQTRHGDHLQPILCLQLLIGQAAALHQKGARTLLCDFDPQANATSGLGIEKRQIKRSIYDVILNGVPLRDAIVHTDFGDVLPSSSDLAGAAVELISADRREYVLKDALMELKEEYDAIFIDCPPSLEMLTLNGLCAAEAIVVPVQCEYFALEGLSDLMGTLRMVKRKMNPRLELFGVVLTMFDGRTNFSNQVAQEVRRHFPGKVFASVVPRNIRLAEAPSHGLPVTVYDRLSRGAAAYRAMAEEMIKRL